MMKQTIRMRWLTSGFLLFSCLPFLPAEANALDAAQCAALVGPVGKNAIGLPSGDVRIEAAFLDAETPLAVSAQAPTPAARVVPAKPVTCKILGAIAPVDPNAPDIRFQINLPVNWNGKAVQYGGGGFNGILITGLALPPGMPFDRPSPLAQGYVTYGTDSGHQLKPNEDVQAFAANDEAFLNFAHAAYKKVRDVAGVTIEKAYGRKPARFYFVGSSEGGREALTVAQRYPSDFDGVFSRVPVINWTGLMHASARGGFATMGDAWLKPQHVQLVHDAVLKTCDAGDGLADGIVAEPVACQKKFMPEALLCKSGEAADACLNQGQIKAVQTLRSPYRFPFPLANGVTEYPGWGISGEAYPASGPTGGWTSWWTGATPPVWPSLPNNGRSWVYGSGALAHIYTRNPNYDVSKYRPEDHKARVLEVSGMMDSTNPDLGPFHARGGKAIILEYMADYAQSPYAGIAYYEEVVKTMGRERADATIRLFTAPGVDHVGAGAPGNVDMLAALDRWVETGTVPTGLSVVEQDVLAPSFPVKRARPLCEWPQQPRYKGGDVSRAESFVCTAP